MNYERFFKSAVSATLDKYPSPDSEKIISVVRERTTKMNKHEENVTYISAADLPEDRPAGRKHRFLTAAAGTAAAVAVVGAGVFGVNYLNANGGLSESNGAAYHAETPAVAAEMNNEITESTVQGGDILKAAGDTLAFSDLSATIEETDFDGQFLRVVLNADFYDPAGADSGFTPHFSICDRSGNGILTNDNGLLSVNTEGHFRCVLYARADLEPGQMTGLGIKYYHIPENNETPAPEPETLGAYTLTGTDISGLSFIAADEETGISAVVTKYCAEIEGNFSKEDYDSLYCALKYNDGTIKTLADRRSPDTEEAQSAGLLYQENYQSDTETGKGRIILFSEGDVLTDTGSITSVIINDTELTPDGAKAYPPADETGTENANEYPGLVLPAVQETSLPLIIDLTDENIPGEFELLHYIDGELHPELTETRELSGKLIFPWNVTDGENHTYKVLARCPENRLYETLFEAQTREDGVVVFTTGCDPELLTALREREQGDLSQIAGIYAPGELPFVYEEADESSSAAESGSEGGTEQERQIIPEILTSRGGIYTGTGDIGLPGEKAWEYVQKLGETDAEFPLPYDINNFTFDTYSFSYSSVDCDYTAIAGGTVEFAGWCNGFGLAVLIHDENGHYWLYSHIALDTLKVETGDVVTAGDILGHTGTTGATTGQHYCLRVG